VLEVSVGRDALRDTGDAAVADQLVVDRARGLVRVANVVAQLRVLEGALEVRFHRRRRVRDLVRRLGHGQAFLSCVVDIDPTPPAAFNALGALAVPDPLKATSKTSSIESTRTNSTSRRVSAGSSSRSASFSRGTRTRRSPARWAASAFSRTPPIGSTWPVRVSSPVMPRSAATGVSRTSDAIAVAIVI